MAGEEGEPQHLTTGQDNAADTVTVWSAGAGTGQGVREGTAGLASNKRKCHAGVYEGVRCVAGVGVAITHTRVEGESDIRHLLSSLHLACGVQVENKLQI